MLLDMAQLSLQILRKLDAFRSNNGGCGSMTLIGRSDRVPSSVDSRKSLQLDINDGNNPEFNLLMYLNWAPPT